METVQVLSILFLLLCSADVLLIDAHVKNEKKNAKAHQDRSSNQILDNDIEMSIVDEHHHYLPSQTTFGSTVSLSTFDASITSPPQINISPASAQSTLEQTVYDAGIEPEPYINDDYITPYLSHCISETPSNEKVVSEQLLPSKELIKESVVLSGHIEIAPKTSNEGGQTKIPDTVSESSVTIRGSQIHMPSATDM